MTDDYGSFTTEAVAEVTDDYGSFTTEAVSKVTDDYGSFTTEEASEVTDDYGSFATEEVSEVTDDYGSFATEAVFEVTDDYKSFATAEVSDVTDDYLSFTTEDVSEVTDDYGNFTTEEVSEMTDDYGSFTTEAVSDVTDDYGSFATEAESEVTDDYRGFNTEEASEVTYDYGSFTTEELSEVTDDYGSFTTEKVSDVKDDYGSFTTAEVSDVTDGYGSFTTEEVYAVTDDYTSFTTEAVSDVSDDYGNSTTEAVSDVSEDYKRFTTEAVSEVTDDYGSFTTKELSDMTDGFGSFTTEEISEATDDYRSFTTEAVSDVTNDYGSFTTEEVSEMTDDNGSFTTEEVSEVTDKYRSFTTEAVSKVTDDYGSFTTEEASDVTDDYGSFTTEAVSEVSDDYRSFTTKDVTDEVTDNHGGSTTKAVSDVTDNYGGSTTEAVSDVTDNYDHSTTEAVSEVTDNYVSSATDIVSGMTDDSRNSTQVSHSASYSTSRPDYGTVGTTSGLPLETDPCFNYTSLEILNRSPFDIHLPPSGLCDVTLIKEGVYYRFGSDGNYSITDYAVDTGRCGTNTPIYLNQSHPTSISVGGEVMAVVCSDRCTWEATIRIRQCGNFFIYALVAPPACYSAYCADNSDVKPEECGYEYPCLTEDPALSDPFINNTYDVRDFRGNLIITAEYFAFNCTVRGYQPTSQRSPALFEVTFMVGQETVSTSVIGPSKLVAQLGQDELVGRLGRDVSCTVRSYYDNSNASPKKSPVRASNNFWAGIRRKDPAEVVMNEQDLDQTVSIALHSTVPITCWHCKALENNPRMLAVYCRQPCQYSTRVVRTARGWSSCAVVINSEQQGGVVQYEMQSTSYIFQYRLLLEILPFEPYPGSDLQYVFGGYKMDDIMIRVVDTEPDAWCGSITDPHMYTFDRGLYNVYITGDFILWEYEDLDIEIQARFKPCGWAACTCGVIIREGNDVIGISRCNKPYFQVIRHLEDATPSRKPVITSWGPNFYMTTPSGIQITVIYSYWWISSVYISIPSRYKGRDTGGLCGNYNGDGSDDLTIRNTNDVDCPYQAYYYYYHYFYFCYPYRFSNSWRVPSSESLFVQRPENCKENSKRYVHACECNMATGLPDCSPPNYSIPPLTGGHRMCGSLGRRSADDETSQLTDDVVDGNDLYSVQDYDVDHGVNVSISWPTPKGKTLADVKARCQEELETSPAYAVCYDSAPDQIERAFNDCVTDVQIMDDFNVSFGIASEMETACVASVESSQNVTSEEVVMSNDTDIISIPEETQAALDNVCPRQCSGHGNCTKRKCQCQPGYGGDDCSVVEGDPPRLSEIQGLGLCDIRKRACRLTRVYGENILQSDNLTCRAAKDSQVVITPARFISPWEIMCIIPNTTVHFTTGQQRKRRSVDEEGAYNTWDVSISNDMEMYSQSLKITVFDAKCQDCTEHACKQLPNTCDIQQRCYGDEDYNPDNVCEQCLIETSTKSWSPLPVNQPPQMTTTEVFKERDTELSTQLDASDAEGHTVTFELVDGSGVTLSETGLLLWAAENNKVQDIVVQLADQCGAKDMHTIRLTTDGGLNLGLILGATFGALAGTVLIAVAAFKLITSNRSPFKNTVSPSTSRVFHK